MRAAAGRPVETCNFNNADVRLHFGRSAQGQRGQLLWADEARMDASVFGDDLIRQRFGRVQVGLVAVSYTHLRAHATVLDLVCRLLLETKTSY